MDENEYGLSADDDSNVPSPGLSMLALDAERLFQKNDCNPFEEDSDFRTLFMALLDAAAIEDLSDLIAADKILDMMYDPCQHTRRSYAVLHGKARCFIERFPQLLEMGWVHSDGCIFQLIEDIRQQRHRLPSIH